MKKASVLFPSIKPEFSADFKTSAIPQLASDATLTFTRGSIAKVISSEGDVKQAKSGEIRFPGARRVENLVTYSEDFSHANWATAFAGTGTVATKTPNYGTAPDGSQTACRMQLDKGAGNTTADYAYLQGTLSASAIAYMSVWMKTNDASTKTICLRNGSRGNVTVTGTWQRFAFKDTSANSLFQIILRGTYSTDNSADLLVWHPQAEEYVGQVTQQPSDYVSTNVLSAPYHGANIDGVKYFSYLNGNTVTSGVVTEAAGAAIAESALYGVFIEEQRINLCPRSEDHGNWTAIATPTITAGNTKAATLVMDLIGDDAAGGLEGYSKVVSYTGNASKSVSVYVLKGTATSSVIRVRDTTGSANRLLVAITWSGAVPVTTYTTGSEEFPPELIGNGIYRLRMLTTSVTAANTNQIEIYPATDAALSNGGTGNITIGGWQTENALTASSYIPTTTASVTRSADVLDYTAANVNPYQGSIIADIEVNYSGSPASNANVIGIGSGSTAGLQISTADTPTVIRMHDGTNSITLTGLNNASTGIVRRGATWGKKGLFVGGNGSVSSAGTYDGAVDFTTLNVGHLNGANQLNGTVKNLSVYKKQLPSNKFAIKLTP